MAIDVTCDCGKGDRVSDGKAGKRFNVLGAWNAVTRELLSVINTTVFNTATMCERLHKIATRGLSEHVPTHAE